MAWELKITDEAENDLYRIENKTAERIRKKLNDIIRLDKEVIVLVVKIAHRSEVYRKGAKKSWEY